MFPQEILIPKIPGNFLPVLKCRPLALFLALLQTGPESKNFFGIRDANLNHRIPQEISQQA